MGLCTNRDNGALVDHGLLVLVCGAPENRGVWILASDCDRTDVSSSLAVGRRDIGHERLVWYGW